MIRGKSGAWKLAERIIDNFEQAGRGFNSQVEAEIERNRKGWGGFLLTGDDGKPLNDVEIALEQKTHEFRFGCNLFKLRDFDSEEKNKAYEGYFKKLFNQAVIPFLWDALEPSPGELRFTAESRKIPRRPPTDMAVDWCLENGVEPKGHWLLCDNFCPSWLPRNSREVFGLLEKRIETLAARYGEKVPVWDVLNEPFGPAYRSLANPRAILPDDYVFQTFKLAEKYFPARTRFLFNDGSEYYKKVFFAEGNSPDYTLIRRLLERGARIDALGIQFHLWGKLEDFIGGEEALRQEPFLETWHVNKRINEMLCPLHLLKAFDQYWRIGLPMNISEISLSTVPDLLPREEAEELQAELATRLYKLWFSHEGMEGIVYWNLCDKTALGTENQWDAGLIGADFEPKPSYKAIDRLINKEWRTSAVIRSDAHGLAEWRGFYGDYDAEFTSGGRRTKRTLRLSKYSPNEFCLAL